MCGNKKKKQPNNNHNNSALDFKGMEDSLESLDSSSIPHIRTEQELASTIKFAGDKLIVLDFYAKWCGPCQAISPIIENWVEEFPSVHFVKANVDKCESGLCERFSVSSIPCFIFIRNGKTIDRFTGGRYPELKQLIIDHTTGTGGARDRAPAEAKRPGGTSEYDEKKENPGDKRKQSSGSPAPAFNHKTKAVRLSQKNIYLKSNIDSAVSNINKDANKQEKKNNGFESTSKRASGASNALSKPNNAKTTK